LIVRGPARHISLTRFISAGTVDLGNEPPLYLSEKPEKTPVPRAISFRWLGGTILTGLTSIFLMGGALMAALDNPNQFASLPDALGLEVGEAGGDDEFGQKSDRMRPIEEEVATRQILQVSTVTRQGERDFIKLRPFAKITATLGSAKEELSAEIPPYDVLRIFADKRRRSDFRHHRRRRGCRQGQRAAARRARSFHRRPRRGDRRAGRPRRHEVRWRR
jgi:hypothetical protein